MSKEYKIQQSSIDKRYKILVIEDIVDYTKTIGKVYPYEVVGLNRLRGEDDRGYSRETTEFVYGYNARDVVARIHNCRVNLLELGYKLNNVQRTQFTVVSGPKVAE